MTWGLKNSLILSCKHFYDILDRRYGECLETLITSNLTLEQLARHYESHGDRLASRIAGMGAVMVLKGKDRRLP